MFMRQLQYLVAVSREGHFGRAAEACRVSQPTLSAGIRRLEEELGLPLVIRSHRFLGLTLEGERVLAWAQRMVADYKGLRQELSDASDGLSGTLRLGVIPAAIPAMPALVNGFCTHYPHVRVQLLSLPSTAIQRGLDELEIDAGVTYFDSEPLSRVRRVPLYEERYVFVTAAPEFADVEAISWADAAEHPLCLLTAEMQNRRIVDRILAAAGVSSNPRMEANSFLGVWSLVRSGAWAGIVPDSYLATFNVPGPLHAIPLVGPEHSQSVGLATSDRDPASPLAVAFLRHVTRVAVRRPQEAAPMLLGACA
ncbi:LysR family transcriptional regulator [Xanthobacter autotrophicus DSM 431]|uniref:LysR family transcriptional regulator n=1 Tax=Xanthobacter nonsaccharivorans TaxID=3119912 RepID=UPI0037277B92